MTKYIDRYYLNGEEYGIKFGGGGRQPGANTLWYLNLNQSDAVFTDAKGHTVTNNGMSYNASGVSDGCGYTTATDQFIYSDFATGENFPSNFTIMGFMKPTGNHYTNDHPMGISLWNEIYKNGFTIGFTQNNSAVQFSFLQENVAWHTYTSTPASILNTRHHYALTYDGTTMKGYIDGTEVISQAVSGDGTGAAPRNGLNLCGRQRVGDSNVSNQYNGYVDEVIVENKVWTQTDIQNYLSLFTY